jgi:hypothetical protein
MSRRLCVAFGWQTTSSMPSRHEKPAARPRGTLDTTRRTARHNLQTGTVCRFDTWPGGWSCSMKRTGRSSGSDLTTESGSAAVRLSQALRDARNSKLKTRRLHIQVHARMSPILSIGEPFNLGGRLPAMAYESCDAIGDAPMLGVEPAEQATIYTARFLDADVQIAQVPQTIRPVVITHQSCCLDESLALNHVTHL